MLASIHRVTTTLDCACIRPFLQRPQFNCPFVCEHACARACVCQCVPWHHQLRMSLSSSPTPSSVADSEHHVRHGVRPERAWRGHGKADRAAGDQAGDTAEQPAGPAGTHQPGHQPAAPGLPGGAAPALRQTQPRAPPIRVPAAVLLHSPAHLLREQLGRKWAGTQRLHTQEDFCHHMAELHLYRKALWFQ